MLIHAVLAAAIATPVLNAHAAGDARIEATFGNTVVSTYPDGRTQHLWVHPDGGWDGIARNGKHIAGTWTVKGEKVCLRQTHPPTLPFSYCTPFPQDPRIGAVWGAKDFFGTPIRLTVLRGLGEPDQRIEATPPAAGAR